MHFGILGVKPAAGLPVAAVSQAKHQFLGDGAQENILNCVVSNGCLHQETQKHHHTLKSDWNLWNLWLTVTMPLNSLGSWGEKEKDVVIYDGVDNSKDLSCTCLVGGLRGKSMA